MASFVKFSPFCSALATGKHNFVTATVWLQLHASAPSTAYAYESQLSADIATGGSYVNGGTSVGVAASTGQTGGTYKLCLTDKVLTAAAGGIATFRYIVLFNQSAANDDLMGYYDYGSNVTLSVGETFTIDFSAANGVLTIA